MEGFGSMEVIRQRGLGNVYLQHQFLAFMTEASLRNRVGVAIHTESLLAGLLAQCLCL